MKKNHRATDFKKNYSEIPNYREEINQEVADEVGRRTKRVISRGVPNGSDFLWNEQEQGVLNNHAAYDYSSSSNSSSDENKHQNSSYSDISVSDDDEEDDESSIVNKSALTKKTNKSRRTNRSKINKSNLPKQNQRRSVDKSIKSVTTKKRLSQEDYISKYEKMDKELDQDTPVRLSKLSNYSEDNKSPSSIKSDSVNNNVPSRTIIRTEKKSIQTRIENKKKFPDEDDLHLSFASEIKSSKIAYNEDIYTNKTGNKNLKMRSDISSIKKPQNSSMMFTDNEILPGKSSQKNSQRELEQPLDTSSRIEQRIAEKNRFSEEMDTNRDRLSAGSSQNNSNNNIPKGKKEIVKKEENKQKGVKNEAIDEKSKIKEKVSSQERNVKKIVEDSDGDDQYYAGAFFNNDQMTQIVEDSEEEKETQVKKQSPPPKSKGNKRKIEDLIEDRPQIELKEEHVVDEEIEGNQNNNKNEDNENAKEKKVKSKGGKMAKTSNSALIKRLYEELHKQKTFEIDVDQNLGEGFGINGRYSRRVRIPKLNHMSGERIIYGINHVTGKIEAKTVISNNAKVPGINPRRRLVRRADRQDSDSDNLPENYVDAESEDDKNVQVLIIAPRSRKSTSKNWNNTIMMTIRESTDKNCVTVNGEKFRNLLKNDNIRIDPSATFSIKNYSRSELVIGLSFIENKQASQKTQKKSKN